MDKKIEEMARELREIQPLFYASIAEQLYNAGYRKITENAVVLTQKELIEMQLKYYNGGAEGTAEKFAERLKAVLKHPLDNPLHSVIDEICKEITEDSK